MKKPLKVCFSGWPGTGTSSAAKALHLRLQDRGLATEIISSGGAFRDLAIERYPHMPKIEALARLEVDAETDRSVDDYIDGRTMSALSSGSSVIFDSRIAPYFAKSCECVQVLCVRLYCPPWISAQRVAARDNDVAFERVTVAMTSKALAENLHRITVAGARYRSYYGIASLASQIPAWDRAFNTNNPNYTTDAIVENVMTSIEIRGWLG